MAYQSPAFFYYHGAREGGPTVTNPTVSGQDVDVFFDSRQGEFFTFDTDFNAGRKDITTTVDPGALSDAIDHVIISGHNFPGAEILVHSDPADSTMLSPNYDVTEAAGAPIVIALTSLLDDVGIELRIRIGTANGSILPSLSEVSWTTKHEMSRGPRPDFDTSWRRNQQRFVNDAGVSSTFLQGPARKTYTLTWQQLVGDDRDIILNMREQTSDWSQPFWFLPPDDTFPIVFVELDRDASFIQDFDNPQGGTSDRVTLSMIEVLG